ncbi:sulfatase family protein [Luteolibacter marinus]|uniref:sulfatase family protein n=1 Tax=Luteolibacter marinus TaxID=2776705 RepID=UPI001866190E|nr:arylsulfatase [Luteolibacter marinus]
MMRTLFPVCLLALAAASAVAAPAKLPNIVILYADDMGYGDLGANHAASKIPTPHLDALAAQGLRFTDGHSSSGICTPSRYAMLTGRYHWRDFHNIVGALGPSVIAKDRLTLPQMLREQGYATACIGKWHLGWNWNAIRKPGTPKNSVKHEDFDWSQAVPDGPLAHGFDHYFGDTVINFPPYGWIEDDKLVKAPDTQLETVLPKAPKEGSWECRPGPACSDWDFYQNLPTLTRKAEEYVRGRKDAGKPFFLYVPFPSPHAPIIPTEEFDGKSQAGPFGDYVAQTDDACGRILAALKETGLEENTIVVFSADNGPEIYAYERDRKFDHWSSAPFRGLKRDIYEGGHHVPFIIKWPGLGVAGSVRDATISQIDLMATFAALTGYQLPPGAAEDSHDFLPYLRDPASGAPRKAIVHNTKKDHYAIRRGDWLLVDAKTGYLRPAPEPWNKKHDQPADDGLPVELYDFKNDPGQRHNLAAEHPDTVKELQALLGKIRRQGHSAPRLDPS